MPGLADEVLQRLHRRGQGHGSPAGEEEALFAGTSTGANVVAALRVAQGLGPGRSVATLACDSGLKYLSTVAMTSQPA